MRSRTIEMIEAISITIRLHKRAICGNIIRIYMGFFKNARVFALLKRKKESLLAPLSLKGFLLSGDRLKREVVKLWTIFNSGHRDGVSANGDIDGSEFDLDIIRAPTAR